MAKEVTERLLFGGLNRGVEPHLIKAEQWLDLINMRPGNGKITQTDSLLLGHELTELAKDTAGTEAQVLELVRYGGTLQYFYANQQTARMVNWSSGVESQLPIVRQIAAPPAADDGGHILFQMRASDGLALDNSFYLRISSTGSEDATLIIVGTYVVGDGDVLEVPSTGSKFRWHVGLTPPADWSLAPELDVAVGGILLDIGGITSDAGIVYFLQTTNLQLGSVFIWRRDDAFGEVVAETTRSAQVCKVNDDIYFAGLPHRGVWRLRDNILHSVGYRRVYGQQVVMYYNHLVIGRFYQAESSGLTDAPTNARFRIGWSTLNDPDNFSTYLLTTEADQYEFLTETNYRWPNQGMTGLSILENTCIIYLTNAIYSMTYIGLPNVMVIRKLFDFGSVFTNGLVTTPRGHYFISQDNFYFFNGLSLPQVIGGEVADMFFDEQLNIFDTYWDSLWGHYDEARSEVIWTYWTLFDTNIYQCWQLVYQEETQRWFKRAMPSLTAGVEDIYCMAPMIGQRTKAVYAGGLNLFKDYVSGSTDGLLGDLIQGVVAATLGVDNTTEVEYGEVLGVPGVLTTVNPYLVTGDFTYGNPIHVKELDSFFIDAGVGTGTAIAVYYSVRSLLSDAVEWQFAGFWTSSLVEGRLSTPQVAGRVFRFKFVFMGTNVQQAVIKSWADIVYGIQQRVER